jgi:hypothetical protein
MGTTRFQFKGVVMTIYSDAALEADLTCGMRGYERRAQILLTVPVEMRSEVVAESQRIMNAIGGRPTEALLAAVRHVEVGA